LLEHGAKLNLQSNEGNTVLHYAVLKNSLESLNVLLNYKVPINLRNKDGLTAAEIAAKRGLKVISTLFKERQVILKEQAATPPRRIKKTKPQDKKTNKSNDLSDSLYALPNQSTKQSFVINEQPKVPPMTKSKEAKSVAQAPKGLQDPHPEKPIQNVENFTEVADSEMPVISKLTAEQTRKSSDGIESRAPFPEKLINIGLDGSLLRRKSDVVIANILYSLDMSFVYERKLCGTVAIGISYPSFTIFRPDNQIIIWEHTGPVNTPEKKEDVNGIIQWYRLNGFQKDKSFYITHDTKQGGIDSEKIIEVAQNILQQIEDAE